MTTKDHIHRVYLTISTLRRHNPIPAKLIASECLKNGLAEDLVKMVMYGRKVKKEPEAIPVQVPIPAKTKKVKGKVVKNRMSYKQLMSMPLYSLKHN